MAFRQVARKPAVFGIDWGDRFEVHPSHQRQGIATRMLKRALTVRAKHGNPEFHLWRHDDSPGVKIYERLGFVRTGQME